VYLGVCLVQFALYVKLRTVMRAAHVFSGLTLIKCIADYNEHGRACVSDKEVIKSCSVLSRAYRLL